MFPLELVGDCGGHVGSDLSGGRLPFVWRGAGAGGDDSTVGPAPNRRLTPFMSMGWWKYLPSAVFAKAPALFVSGSFRPDAQLNAHESIIDNCRSITYGTNHVKWYNHYSNGMV